MGATLKSLNQVLGLKKRRITKLEAKAAEEAQHVKACEAQLAEVQESQRQAEAVEQQVKETIEAMSTRAQGFFPSDLITLQHVLEMKVAETKAIVKQVQAAEKQLEAAKETVRQTRKLIEKSEQQVDQLTELRDKLAQEISLAAEDVTDEESEEASVARLVAAAYEAVAQDVEDDQHIKADRETSWT